MDAHYHHQVPSQRRLIRQLPPTFIPNFPAPINPFLLDQPQIPGTPSYSTLADSSAVAAANLPAQHTPSINASYATPSTAPISIVFPAQDPSTGPLPSSENQSTIEQMRAEPHIMLDEMLKDIAKAASSAGDACRLRHDAEATFKVDELKERITRVAEMISRISLARSSEPFSLSTYTSTADYHNVADSLAAFAATQSGAMNIVTHIPTQTILVPPASAPLDHSRKRGPAALDEERAVKSLKREPMDDLSAGPMSSVDQPMPADPASSFTPTIPAISSVVAQSTRSIAPLPHSRPSSRPPTPSAFSQSAFAPSKAPHPSYLTYTPYIEFNSPTVTSPTFPPIQQNWSESVTSSLPSRHQHSLSAGSIQGMNILPTPPLSSGLEGFSSPPLHQVVTPLPTPPAVSPTIGRMSRSGSISGSFNSGQFTYSFQPFSDANIAWPGNSRITNSGVPTTNPLPPSPSPGALTTWFMNSADSVGPNVGIHSSLSALPRQPNSSDEEEEDDDDIDDHINTSPRIEQLSPSASSPGSSNHQGTSSASSASTSSDVPQEYRTEVDRIFFEYLNKICSNLEATDSKGEPIHQTLMAKKMQRLDESPDFRPFKFRIQAFTLAFLEELARQGYPEEKIPMKKVRNYLWRQQYILRYNEDGKKAKSKGNHIWNIEAKKAGDGKWEFRPFHRKLAGLPPNIAYSGIRWSWTPRVWDPQASFQNVPVRYTSPWLPKWLSWKDDVLSGTPPFDAESCEITVTAHYAHEGQEGQLSHTFTLTVAPMTSIDTSAYPRSRRPSVVSESPRRSSSDSALFQQAFPRSKPRSIPVPTTVNESPNARVIRVLQTVAQRVSDETESQFVSSSPKQGGDLQDLVKQKHVLEQTMDAYDKTISGQGHNENRRLALAAQNVVVAAANIVIADKSVANGVPPPPPVEPARAIECVTMNELTDATQDAIAEAVKRNGTASTEVDIIVAATSILQSRTPASPHAIVETSAGMMAIPRSHSTSIVPPRMIAPPPSVFQTPLPPLSEYA